MNSSKDTRTSVECVGSFLFFANFAAPITEGGDYMDKYVMAIIIFCMWYLTIGAVIMAVILTNFKDGWKTFVDEMINDIYQLKFYPRNIINWFMVAFYTVLWGFMLMYGIGYVIYDILVRPILKRFKRG